MSISIISFETNKEVSSIEAPSFIEQYKDADTKSVSRVHYISKKISFIKTASTKGISDVSGTTKKPFKQKGTGNARQGSLRSPQYRGGGIIFGPKPITATYKINKKEKIHAKKVLISKLFAAGCITIVDEINLPSFKTKDAIKAIQNLQLTGSIAIIHNNEISYEGLKSVSNIPNVGAYSSDSFHIYEVVKYDSIVFTKSAFEKFTQVL